MNDTAFPADLRDTLHRGLTTLGLDADALPPGDELPADDDPADTPAVPASLPVPEVVGMAISGSIGRVALP